MSEQSQAYAVVKRSEDQQNEALEQIRTQQKALEQIRTQKTPEEAIKWREGRKGEWYPYTNTAYVIRQLNEAFAWNWDFECDSEEMILRNGEPFEIKVRGRLTVRAAGYGTIVKTQYGCQPLQGGPKAPSYGDCYKGAASDALKKCASMLGIALDLYDSGSQIDKGRSGNAPAAPGSNGGETEAEKRMRLAKEKAGLTKAEPKPQNGAVTKVADYGSAMGGDYDKLGELIRAAGVEDSSGLRRWLYTSLANGAFDAAATTLKVDAEMLKSAFKHLSVTASQGPSKDLMKNPKHSAATSHVLSAACRRLVAYGVSGEELLREVNFALTSLGKDAVQSRYELDDESALMITKSFNEWADTLDRKAMSDKLGV